MTEPLSTKISIPYAPGERSKSYEAKVQYLLMGQYRNLRDIALKQRVSQAQVNNWAGNYDWNAAAREYDEAVASHKIKLAEETYKRDVEEYMSRYRETGRELQETAMELLRTMRGRITSKDFTITQNSLGLASRALMAAADLEAHSLRISEILPQFETVDSGKSDE